MPYPKTHFEASQLGIMADACFVYHPHMVVDRQYVHHTRIPGPALGIWHVGPDVFGGLSIGNVMWRVNFPTDLSFVNKHDALELFQGKMLQRRRRCNALVHVLTGEHILLGMRAVVKRGIGSLSAIPDIPVRNFVCVDPLSQLKGMFLGLQTANREMLRQRSGESDGINVGGLRLPRSKTAHRVHPSCVFWSAFQQAVRQRSPYT